VKQNDIVQAVREGRARFDWVELRPGLEVFADALKVDGVRVTVSAETAQRVADLLGASLTTPLIEDEVYARAAVRLPPFTIPTGPDASWEQTVWHSRKIDEALTKLGAEPGELVATVGKSWVLVNALRLPTGGARIVEGHEVAANYGWHSRGAPHPAVSGGTPVWQSVGLRHNLKHHDYSQTLRLARGKIISEAQTLVVVRQPGVAFEKDTDPAFVNPSLSLGERAVAWAREEMRVRPRPDAARRREFFSRCVREKGGKLQRLNLTDGNWCAAGACMAATEVLQPGDVLPHLYRASGLELERDAVMLGNWLPASEVRAGRAAPSPGDIVILHRGPPEKWGNAWERHVARVEDWDTPQNFACLDANGAGSQWRRVMRSVDNPALRGFVLYGERETLEPREDPELERLLSLAQGQAFGVDWAELAADRDDLVEEA
jgi:hypothetical protein